MTPQFIMQKSLCRVPHCAGPYELRDTPLKDWPTGALSSWRRSAESEIECMDWASEYGEPGYGPAPKRGILFANWNYFPRGLDTLLERAGYAIEWSDEWIVNWDGDQKAYRTSADSHGWKSSIVWLEDGTMLAKGEIEPHSSALNMYLEHLIDSPRHADSFDIDWTKHGFTNMNGTFESGWHPGQNDDPEKILAEYQAKFPDKEFIFQIPSVGQFDIEFTIWGRDKEEVYSLSN